MGVRFSPPLPTRKGYFVNIERICTKCKQTKSLDCFAWRCKKQQKKQRICKECVKKNSSIWYQTNKQACVVNTRKRTMQYVERNVSYIRELNLQCEKCGENHPAVLEFHHIDPNEKEREVSLLVHRGCNIQKIQEEIKKCKVLCANCHKKEHWNIKQGLA